jgi:hypothetical protein
MKLKADKRNKRRNRGQHEWKSQVGDLVVFRRQPFSEATRGVTNKLGMPCESPWLITKLIPPSSYETSSANVEVCGVFRNH